MYKLLISLALTTLPALALANDGSAAPPTMEGQPMTHGHDMGSMNGNMSAGHDMSGMHGGHDMEAMHGGMHGSGSSAVPGMPGDPAKATRTIMITMDDSMRFTPPTVSVNAGETVRFFVKNSGQLSHELVLGSAAALKEHAAMMRKNPGMQHTEANMVTLAPGQRGGLVWQFDKPGTVDFACLVPGHLEAGMVGKVEVANPM